MSDEKKVPLSEAEKAERGAEIIKGREDRIEIVEALKNYTGIDKFVRDLVDIDGETLAETNIFGKNIADIYLPKNEVDHVHSDGEFHRYELLGSIAAAGNERFANVQVSPAEMAAMAETMEKWGLDPSEFYENHMIEGLAKFDKYYYEKNPNNPERSTDPSSDMNKQFQDAHEGVNPPIWLQPVKEPELDQGITADDFKIT